MSGVGKGEGHTNDDRKWETLSEKATAALLGWSTRMLEMSALSNNVSGFHYQKEKLGFIVFKWPTQIKRPLIKQVSITGKPGTFLCSSETLAWIPECTSICTWVSWEVVSIELLTAHLTGPGEMLWGSRLTCNPLSAPHVCWLPTTANRRARMSFIPRC